MSKGKVRRTRKTKKRSKNNIYEEIITVFIVATGALMGVSLFSDAAGVFGKGFKAICLGLFSYVAYTIPILFIAYGIHFFLKKDRAQYKYKYWLGLLIIALISAVGHIFNYSESIELSLVENISKAYELGQMGQAGGVVGFLIAEPIINMFGIWGAGIIVFTCIIVFFMLVTEISLFSVSQSVYPYLKKAAQFLKQKLIRAIEKLKSYNTNDGEEELADEDIIIRGNADFGMDDSQGQLTANEEEIKIFDHQQEQAEQTRVEDVASETDETLAVDKTSHMNSSTSSNRNTNGEKKIEDLEQSISMNEYIQYSFPPIDLLNKSEVKINKKNKAQDLRNTAKKLEETLKSFGVEAKVLQISKGPAVTRYELQPSAGVKVSKIVNLADDIALNLAAQDVRIEAPIPGKAAIGIEVPNKEVTPVYLREVIEQEEFHQYPSKLAFALGQDIAGRSIITDIAKMPHLLIAGATGSGKSVCINTLITSILYKATPNEVRLVMIDPKVVELSVYNGIPHLLIPVVTDPKKAAGALHWAVQEMVNRYKLFADNNVRDLQGYNALQKEQGTENTLPEIVIIIDELADLMMVAPNEVEDYICRLAQMARAAGMHLVIATQRPSVNVITGVIKANIPSRISFAVSSQVDSRTILDSAGAEKLLGKGDMLFYPVGTSKPKRIQGAFISDKEVENIVEYIKAHSGANYQEDILEEIENQEVGDVREEEDADELLPQAIELVVNAGQASVSMLQRRLKVGYARAARLVDQMEARGIVGEFEGSKPRQVLITKEQYNEMLVSNQELAR